MQQRYTDTLTNAVQSWCLRHGVTLAGKTVLCAVSGGRDSMALLHVLLRLGTHQGFSVAAAHYNHLLRESAARDEALVRQWCEARGVPLAVDRGDVRSYAEKNGRSIEDAARMMRYQFLESAAAEYGADFIATAHHIQDNAETLLLHLLRGSGLTGLCGITPVRGSIIRPLLEIDRTAIDGYIAENAIPYAEDETNTDITYTRNRLRLELLPLLEEIAPGSTERIAATASRLRADEEFLEQYTTSLLPLDTAEIPAEVLKTQPAPIAARLVRTVARRMGAELNAAQIEAAANLRSGGCISLCGGLRAARDGKVLRFFRLDAPSAPLTLSPGQQQWGKWLVTVYETENEVAENETTVVLRCDVSPIIIAPWDGTGRLGIENGRRTIKRLLADHGIPPSRRESCPAVFSGENLAAVFGAGTDISFRPQTGKRKTVITLDPCIEKQINYKNNKENGLWA